MGIFKEIEKEIEKRILNVTYLCRIILKHAQLVRKKKRLNAGFVALPPRSHTAKLGILPVLISFLCPFDFLQPPFYGREACHYNKMKRGSVGGLGRGRVRAGLRQSLWLRC